MHKTVIAGEDHQGIDEGTQSEEKRKCVGVNIDSRSANSATIG